MLIVINIYKSLFSTFNQGIFSPANSASPACIKVKAYELFPNIINPKTAISAIIVVFKPSNFDLFSFSFFCSILFLNLSDFAKFKTEVKRIDIATNKSEIVKTNQ